MCVCTQNSDSEPRRKQTRKRCTSLVGEEEEAKKKQKNTREFGSRSNAVKSIDAGGGERKEKSTVHNSNNCANSDENCRPRPNRVRAVQCSPAENTGSLVQLAMNHSAPSHPLNTPHFFHFLPICFPFGQVLKYCARNEGGNWVRANEKFMGVLGQLWGQVCEK